MNKIIVFPFCIGSVVKTNNLNVICESTKLNINLPIQKILTFKIYVKA